MAIEILIRLQKQFNEPLLAPLCDRYIFYFERYLNKGYKKNSKTMALYKVKKELVKKSTNQKNVTKNLRVEGIKSRVEGIKSRVEGITEGINYYKKA